MARARAGTCPHLVGQVSRISVCVTGEMDLDLGCNFARNQARCVIEIDLTDTLSGAAIQVLVVKFEGFDTTSTGAVTTQLQILCFNGDAGNLLRCGPVREEPERLADQIPGGPPLATELLQGLLPLSHLHF
jgi:hypothetical protein